MEVFLIILLIILGISLILLEFLVIPGTTISAIGGFLLLGSGVYLSYNLYGNYIGNITVVVTGIAVVIAFIYALRSGTWRKAMLKAEIKGVANTFDIDKINIGDKGITISRLAPMGKVLVNNILVEAKSINDFINQQTEIEVVQIEQNKLIVKTYINNNIK